MTKVNYLEILKRNSELGYSLTSQPYNIHVLSNIIVNQLKEFLEYTLRSNGINANVTFGNYDNIIQDSQNLKKVNSIIIFWELSNLFNGFHYNIDLYEEKKIEEILEKTKIEIDFVIENLEAIPLVVMNLFNASPFNDNCLNEGKMDILSSRLNEHVALKKVKSLYLVDLKKPLSILKSNDAYDYRYFYSSKSLYTAKFFKTYSNFIKPIFLAANAKSKKALILDCDNTLWKGIVGEDGYDKIEMSNRTSDGAIFHEIQSLVLKLYKQGVLICLCSKNNLKDVEKVLKKNKDMLIRENYITIKKINWLNKFENIKKIAEELNIGLESLVFLDDSPFEVNMIKENLPEVLSYQVPEQLSDYPKQFRSIMNLFYSPSNSYEDQNKTLMYKEQTRREASKKKFMDINDYLSSLSINIVLFKDDLSQIARLAQITQKTNQFNLTTKRYTEKDIEILINSNNNLVYSISVSDKFGDSGITGLCIVNVNSKLKIATIDSFMMSCRIIGRNIEYVFMKNIIEDISKIGIKGLHSLYIKSSKNGQVRNFFEKSSFKLSLSSTDQKKYELDLKNYRPMLLDYITIKKGKFFGKEN